MNNVINVIAVLAITLSGSIFTPTHAANNNYKQGYISDELFIYMHTGPGTKYRILGSIVAGSSIKITGAADNGYSEVIDNKNRTAWVESKYVSTKPGLRVVVDELNNKIINRNDMNNKLDGEVNELQSRVTALTSEKKNLSAELKKLTITLEKTKTKIKDQDTKIKKEYFFNGALVLGIGLLLGLVLPRLFARRRNNSSMENWS